MVEGETFLDHTREELLWISQDLKALQKNF